MSSSSDLLRTIGVVVCLVSLLSACARSPSTSGEEGPESIDLEGADSAQPLTTSATGLRTPLAAGPSVATSPVQTTCVPECRTASPLPTVPNLPADLPSRTADAPGGRQMPIFVEIVRAPLWPDSSALMPPADASPAGVFAFDPSKRLLLVQPSVEILPTTTVLIGMTEEGVTGVPYVSSELFQIPSTRTAPLTVIAIDADTASLTVAYGERIFEINPGQSLSFKERQEGELVATWVATITNHGRLAAIGLLPSDPTSP